MRLPSPKNSPRITRMESTLPFLDYIYKNDVKNVKTYIAEQHDVNATDSKGRTALFLAASFNRYELIEVLLTSGCDVNVTDPLGNTPLHEAAEKGNTDIVRMLAKHVECDLDARNYDGETPLMKAAYYDYGEIARTLLREGANPNAVEDSGQTPLLIALKESSHATVDHLLKHGSDVSVTDKLGHSALYTAIHSTCNKSLDLAKTLLGSGYDISQDKEWILHEEKHNLFYQDDEFYNRLCRILTHSDATGRNVRSYSTNDASPLSSPALRLRRMATVTGPPSANPQSPSLGRKSSNSSPLVSRKSSNTASPPFSPVCNTCFTPPGSPTVAGRKISPTSVVKQCQDEAPMSPVTRMRRTTPCPPPTENMLGSPKLAPKLHISTTLPSSIPNSPIGMRRKTSQTSPLAKTTGNYSPLSSPESSNPSSPITPRKVSQTSPSGRSTVTSPLVRPDAHITSTNNLDQNVADFQSLHKQKALSTTETLLSDLTAKQVPSSPSIKRMIKQGSLDSATSPGSPVFRRQICVKFDLKDNTDKNSVKNIQRQTSVPAKNSVQFSADVQIIELPHK